MLGRDDRYIPLVDSRTATALSRARNVMVLHFASVLHDVTTVNASTDVADAVDGYYNAWSAFAAVYSFAAWSARINSGYQFLLRPLTPNVIQSVGRCRLIEARFRAFDFSDLPVENGSFKGVEIGGWEPNWFRPTIEINGYPVVFASSSGMYYPANAGDQSMGIGPMPYCIEGNFQVVDQQVQQLNVSAACGRLLAADQIQQYPVLASLYFILQEE